MTILSRLLIGHNKAYNYKKGKVSMKAFPLINAQIAKWACIFYIPPLTKKID